MPRNSARDVGLPPRPFLYTLDQIATLVDLTMPVLRRYVHYDGRSVGVRSKRKFLARNIAPEGESPDWRIAEREVARWLRAMGFRLHERGYVID